MANCPISEKRTVMADLHLDNVKKKSEVLRNCSHPLRDQARGISEHSTSWDEEKNRWPTLFWPLIFCKKKKKHRLLVFKDFCVVQDRIAFKPYLSHRALQSTTRACSLSLSPEEVAYGHIVPTDTQTRRHTDTHTLVVNKSDHAADCLPLSEDIDLP